MQRVSWKNKRIKSRHSLRYRDKYNTIDKFTKSRLFCLVWNMRHWGLPPRPRRSRYTVREEIREYKKKLKKKTHAHTSCFVSLLTSFLVISSFLLVHFTSSMVPYLRLLKVSISITVRICFIHTLWLSLASCSLRALAKWHVGSNLGDLLWIIMWPVSIWNHTVMIHKLIILLCLNVVWRMARMCNVIKWRCVLSCRVSKTVENVAPSWVNGSQHIIRSQHIKHYHQSILPQLCGLRFH